MGEERTPFHFRPMHELERDNHEVQLAKRSDGQVVVGWLYTRPTGERTFWTADGRGHLQVDPIGWREIPTTAVIEAWKAQRVAA